MKDYSLIKYLAKLTGAKVKGKKSILDCYFPYSETVVIPTSIVFNRRQSQIEFFDLREVFGTYAKSKYGSYDDFVNAFVSKYDVFESVKYEGVLCVQSNLLVNKLEHTVSAALVNVSVIVISLNEMLGRKERVITENEWRELHRDMLGRQKKISKFSMYGAVCGFALGIAVTALAGNAGLGLLFLLGIAVIFASPVAFIFLFIRYKFYKSQLNRAIREKEYK